MKKRIVPVLAFIGMLSQINAQSPVDFATIDTKRINSDSLIVWEQFGPGGSGNNYHLYWHPTDPNTVYQGPNMGNSYRSTDRGDTYDGIMDPDGPGYKSWQRGPVEIYAPEFSWQDENFGMCGMENDSYVYYTNNKGLSWQRRDDVSAQFDNLHINTFEVDPTDDNIWYAGSGNVRDCNHFFFTYLNPHGVFGSQKEVPKPGGGSVDYGHRARIWKSIDKGETWNDITPEGINPLAQITRIFVHPTKPGTLFAPTSYGFYKSIDGGATWEAKTGTGLDNDIIRSMDMHHNPLTDKVTLFAIDLVKYIPEGQTMKYNGGIYKSTDEGDSWENINNNMPLEGTLLNGYTIKKSYYKTGLAKWFQKSESDVMALYPEIPDSMLHSVSMIRVNPKNPDHILVVNNYKSQFTFQGGMLWRTDDGGENWYITLRNGTGWEGADKAMWEERSNPTSHNVDWLGQDEWENRDVYDRKAGATVEFNSDGTCIMYQVAKVVCVSNDNGDSWLENDEKETVPGNHTWVGAGNSNLPGMEIVQDIRHKDFIYLCSGENSIFKTTNDGDKVRPGAQAVYKISIPHKADPDECSVSTMAVHPDDTTTLFSLHFRQAFFGKLMKSVNSGQSWSAHGELFDPADYGSPVNMSIKQQSLLIDPANVNRFYCLIAKKYVNDVTSTNAGTFSAYGVYRSMDGGLSFELVNDGLPSSPSAQKIGMDPLNTGVVFAALAGSTTNPGGLYRLADGSSSWQKMKIPNGMVSVHDFYFSEDGRLYISGGTLTGPNNKGGVWYTENRDSWSQIFPYKYSNHVRVAKYDTNLILVSVPSTKSAMLNPGIYLSRDKGLTWTKINTGNIQSDRLNDLEIDNYKPGVYYCSTYGAGYYIAKDKSVKPTIISATEISIIDQIELIPVQNYTLEPLLSPVNSTYKDISYKSENPSVASVNSLGLITAVSKGKTSITASHIYTGIESKTIVNVRVPVTGVEIDLDTLNLSLGSDTVLTIIVSPSDVSNDTLTFESTNPSVVSVSDSGKVVALNPGSATIIVTAEDGNFKDSVLVFVVDPALKTSTYLSRDEFIIFPNPVSSVLHVKSENRDLNHCKISIYNTGGEKVLEFGNVFAEKYHASLALDGLVDGPYIMNIRFQDSSINKQFVKY